MDKHTYITANEAFERADKLALSSEPFFIAVDFELKRAMLYPLSDIPHTIHFVCGNHSTSSVPVVSPVPVLSKLPMSYDRYLRGFDYIKQQIHAGNSYLVNYTGASEINTDSTLAHIYSAASARFKLLVQDEFVVFSPERFISVEGETILTYPMKGTIDAAILNAESLILADAKEKAEHATVVDLLRNDLSKVSNRVEVNRYRYIETIRTAQASLLQVSSEIEGRLMPQYCAKIGSILREILPAGSVSGAPKMRTLEIIKDAEQGPRGFYCGIMGVFDGTSFSSGVLIRYIEQTAAGLVYRSGGGITHLSSAESEYNELIHKIYVPTA